MWVKPEVDASVAGGGMTRSVVRVSYLRLRKQAGLVNMLAHRHVAWRRRIKRTGKHFVHIAHYWSRPSRQRMFLRSSSAKGFGGKQDGLRVCEGAVSAGPVTFP